MDHPYKCLFWSAIFALILWGLVFVSVSQAATYYVDCNANGDAGTGLTTAADVAWKTIAKVNASSFSAGDSVLFNKGCTWREQLTVPSSGSSGSPITFGAYGTGAAPVITGKNSLAVGDWSDDGSNVWKATVTASTILYVDFGSLGGKVVASKALCTADRLWYFASNVLYVYATSNPGTYYTSVEPVVRTTGISLAARSYITLSGLEIRDFTGAGVDLTAAAYNTIQYCKIDGNTYNATSANSRGISLFNAGCTNTTILNCTITRCTYGIYSNSLVGGGHVVKNNLIAGNWNWGMLDQSASGTSIAYSYNLFWANGVWWTSSLSVSREVYLGTDAGNNILVSDPLFTDSNKFADSATIFTVSVDDVMSTTLAAMDALVDVYEAKGLKASFGIYTKGMSDWTLPQAWFAAGHNIASHSYTHQYYTTLNSIVITYTGDASTATVTVSGNALTTTLAGDQTDGSAALNIDLTNASYDTIQELVAFIAAQTGYSCTKHANTYNEVRSKVLADVAGQNIKVAYTAVNDKQRLMEDELAFSKATLEANISGLTVTEYIYPGGFTDSDVKTWTAAAGYTSARGVTGNSCLLDSYLTGTDLYNMNTTQINTLDGLTEAQIDQEIKRIAYQAKFSGKMVNLYIHTAELTTTSLGYVLDAVLKYGTYKTLAEAATWLKTLNQQGTTGYYVAPFSNVDSHLQAGSPAIDAGTDVGLTVDIDGISFFGLPDIGAYEFISGVIFGGGSSGGGTF
jgi:hypothetical protein